MCDEANRTYRRRCRRLDERLQRDPAPGGGRPNTTYLTALWPIIRRQGVFLVSELLPQIPETMSAEQVRYWLRRLTRAGYLEREHIGYTRAKKPQYRYRLVRDSVESPRLALREAGCAQDQLWRAMRILGEFSLLELWAASQTERCQFKKATAANYVSMLRQAGYVVGTRPKRYRLLPSKRGPHAPMMRSRGGRMCLYDPNRDAVVWQSGGKA